MNSIVENQARDLPATGFVKQSTILQFIPIGKSTWWRWVNQGKAPRPIKLGANTTVWKAEDIRNLIIELASEETRND